MDNRTNKEEVNALKRDLAVQLLEYINKEESVALHWTGTKTNLIELTSYLYAEELVTNEYDIPLSMKELTRRVCHRFNVGMPKSLSRFLENIENVQGVKSRTLIALSVHEKKRYGRKMLINRFITIE